MRQIFVDSRDRISGTPSDFTIQLPATLVLPEGHTCRIDDLRVPITIPTVSSLNDKIQVQMGSSSYTVTIPIGQYDGPGLASVVQQALQGAVPGVWTCNYSTALISMLVACNNPFTFTGGSFMNQLLQRPYTQTDKAYYFSYVPVVGCDVLYLCSKDFATMETVGPTGSNDTLMSVPVNTPYGGVQVSSMSSVVWIDCPAVCTQQLSFQLRDRDYNILHQVPNISFVLTID